MSATAWWIFGGVYAGCFIAEALDGFKATRRMFREMARQQRWFWGKVADAIDRL